MAKISRAKKLGAVLVLLGIILSAAPLGLAREYSADMGLLWNIRHMEVVFYDRLEKTFMGIAEFRQEYPMYSDMPDDEVARRLHKKYFAYMPLEEYRRIFMESAPAGTPENRGVKKGDILGIRGDFESFDSQSSLVQVITSMDAASYELYDVKRHKLSFPYRYALVGGLILASAGLLSFALLGRGRKADTEGG